MVHAYDVERIIPRLSYHLEEPRVGQSYPNLYVAQLASKFVKVVMSGAGGDELFAGYPWRYYTPKPNEDFNDYLENYYNFWQRLTTDTERTELCKPIASDLKNIDTKAIFRDIFPHNFVASLSGVEDFVNASLYFEAKTFLHGLFVVEDKISMANGLETRVPFMDNDLVDFAMRCPVSIKLANLSKQRKFEENTPNKSKAYFAKNSDGKRILREVMMSYIPPEVVAAPKQGFSSPDASWLVKVLIL